jgi:ATP-dependent DNA ligase
MPATRAGLVFFIFDLLHLDGDDVGARPLIERKARLTELLSGAAPPLHYSDYHRGRGPMPSLQSWPNPDPLAGV